MRFKDYSGTEQFRPLSAWAYFGYAILFAIPVIGWIVLLVFSFSRKNYNRRSYARSYWCWLIIVVTVLAVRYGTGLFDNELSDMAHLASRIKMEIVEKVSPTEGPNYTITANPTVSVEYTPKVAIMAKPTERAAINATIKPTTMPTTEPRTTADSANHGVTPAFKETMDEYEAFFDSYFEFMENFDSSNSTFTQLAKYTKLLTQFTETMEALEAIEDDTLTDADALYYAEVMLRINRKLVNANLDS